MLNKYLVNWIEPVILLPQLLPEKLSLILATATIPGRTVLDEKTKLLIRSANVLLKHLLGTMLSAMRTSVNNTWFLLLNNSV